MYTFITYGSSHPSIGVLVGLPFAALLFFGFVALAIWASRTPADIWSSFPRKPVVWVLSIVAVFTLAVTAFSFYPFSGEYHSWQKISGTVTSTNSRFLAARGGADQKFVVTFNGSGQQFGCNDTRCSTVRKGDELTITCKRTFQWFGTPGYDCNFVSMEVK